jgi:hypothetical protein
VGNKQKFHKSTIYPKEIYDLKVEEKLIPFEIAKKYFLTIFNSKLVVCYNCVKCGKSGHTQFRHLKKRNTDKPYCNNCWLKMKTSENTAWLKKNSDTQKIIQNTDEVKNKNRKAVSLFWKNNPEKIIEMRKKILSNPNVKNYNYNHGFFILENGNKILFESNYELLYILYCDKNNILIRRFEDKDHFIKYKNSIKNKLCLYKPDFIINEKTIVEVKGSKINKVLSYQIPFLEKKEALEKSGREHIFLYKEDIKKISGINRFRKGNREFDNLILSLLTRNKIIISSKKYKEYYHVGG